MHDWVGYTEGLVEDLEKGAAPDEGALATLRSLFSLGGTDKRFQAQARVVAARVAAVDEDLAAQFTPDDLATIKRQVERMIAAIEAFLAARPRLTLASRQELVSLIYRLRDHLEHLSGRHALRVEPRANRERP